MKARAQVLQAVRRYPGIHVREIERRLGLPSRLAAYHLEQLQADGEVQCMHEPGFARYFPSLGKPKWTRREMQFLGLMRHSVALRITVLLLSEGGLPQGQLAKRLDLAKASASYHLALLEKAGLTQVRRDGRKRIYSLVDPAHVRGLLANFTPIPEDLDTFTSIWNDLFR